MAFGFFSIPPELEMIVYENLQPEDLLSVWQSDNIRTQRLVDRVIYQHKEKNYFPLQIQILLEYLSSPLSLKNFDTEEEKGAYLQKLAEFFYFGLEKRDLEWQDRLTGLIIIGAICKIPLIFEIIIDWNFIPYKPETLNYLSRLLNCLPAEVLMQIPPLLQERLTDADPKVRISAYTSLEILAPHLPSEAIISIAKFLKSELMNREQRIRVTAYESFQLLVPKLPQDILLQIAEELQNQLTPQTLNNLTSVLVKLPAATYTPLVLNFIKLLNDPLKSGLHASILSSLEKFIPNLSQEDLVRLIPTLKDFLNNPNSEVRLGALACFKSFVNKLDQKYILELIKIFAARVVDQNPTIQTAALACLQILAPKLPLEYLAMLVPTVEARLQDKNLDQFVSVAALNCLNTFYQALPEIECANIIDEIQNTISRDRLGANAAAALLRLTAIVPTIPQNKLYQIIQTIEPYLTDTDIQAMLDDTDSSIRERALYCVATLAARLPEVELIQVVQLIRAQIANEDPDIHRAALSCLYDLVSKLPEAELVRIVEAIEVQLNNEMDFVREMALEALITLTAKLPETMLPQIVRSIHASLENEPSWNICLKAIPYFQACAPKLPEDLLAQLADNLQAQLNHEDPNIRCAILSCLVDFAQNLPEARLAMIAGVIQAGLNDEDTSVRDRALLSLSPLAAKLSLDLRIPLVQALQEQLNYDNQNLGPEYRANILKILAELTPNLPQTALAQILQRVEGQLNDTVFFVRAAALHCFKQLIPNLSAKELPQIPKVFQARLADVEPNVRETALSCLTELELKFNQADFIELAQGVQARLTSEEHPALDLSLAFACKKRFNMPYQDLFRMLLQPKLAEKMLLFYSSFEQQLNCIPAIVAMDEVPAVRRNFIPP